MHAIEVRRATGLDLKAMMEDFKSRFDAHDWAKTPLGKKESWPPHLVWLADFILESPKPVFAHWGEDDSLLFNEAFAQILGARSIEALGACRPALWTDLWEITDPFVRNATAGRSGITESLALVPSAREVAETCYYSLSYNPLRDLSGHIVGAIMSCTDNTEKSAALRRLKTERATILRLFEEAPGFLAMLVGPEHRFAFANPSYHRLVGRADLVGRAVEDALPELMAQGFHAILDRVYSSGERVSVAKVPVELQPGPESERQLRYVSFVCEPMKGEDGAVVGIFVEGQDVTDEVFAQQRVQALQSELIHLSRVSAMGTMAATLAHELNQPLTAIRNYVAGSRRLLERVKGSEEIGTVLAEIGKSAARAGEVIASLREMTKRGEIKQQRFCPDEAITAAVSLSAVGGCADVELECRLADSMPVVGDAVQIQQVLLNLIRNACEAAQGGDRGRVVITSSMKDGYVVVTVGDNGPGISAEHLSSVFDAFFSTKQDGMGVGLSISRTIVEAHNGTIWAENLPQGGACFSFTLPVAGSTKDLASVVEAC